MSRLSDPLALLFAWLLETWRVLGQMAPWLLFGFLVAGALSVLVSPAWLERHLGARKRGAVLKAALFGVPLPLCSCGVIPVAASLRRHGAGRPATTSFLLSTPQTGVDSIVVTWSLLGPVFAVFRPLAALVSGIAGGALVRAVDGEGREPTGGEPGGGPAASGEDAGCGAAAAGEAGCCADCCAPPGRGGLRQALRYGLVTLPRDIAVALLLGVAIAGLLAALLPPDALAPYLGGGVLSILALMALGVPIYVCATASVPIAAGLIHLGVSPGAALAFLIAGPATNAATITTVWRVLGQRTTIAYLATIAASAVGWGLLLNWLLPTATASFPGLAHHHHDAATTAWLDPTAAVALLLLLAVSYAITRRAEGRAVAMNDADTTGGLTLAVRGMTCSHCAENVRRALMAVPGVRAAEVDRSHGQARILGRDLDAARLAAAVEAAGYEATPAGD
ncbi:MAG: SO_0444 family Cu/Zn efflux transporter [Candidatus Krumholzibacteriota bacterium]|nr:SO_0444 family Cu/Zn efflux transporter [Candidatus Krumholzibacteriota bacterium]